MKKFKSAADAPSFLVVERYNLGSFARGRVCRRCRETQLSAAIRFCFVLAILLPRWKRCFRQPINFCTQSKTRSCRGAVMCVSYSSSLDLTTARWWAYGRRQVLRKLKAYLHMIMRISDRDLSGAHACALPLSSGSANTCRPV